MAWALVSAPLPVAYDDRAPEITSCVSPQRERPLAMLHSKTARFSAVQAAQTERTARISSTVSTTTIGVEESIRIFSRSVMSAMPVDHLQVASVQYLIRHPPEISLRQTKVTIQTWQIIFRRSNAPVRQ